MSNQAADEIVNHQWIGAHRGGTAAAATLPLSPFFLGNIDKIDPRSGIVATTVASFGSTLSRPVRWLFASAILLVSVVSYGRAEQLKPEQIYQKVLPSVMTLEVVSTENEKFVGSAFLALEEGIAITAWHVVHDARSVVAKFADNERYEIAGFIDKDEKRDLAIIRLDLKAPRPLASLCTDAPQVGSRAYVLGAPKGFEFSFTDGMISQIQRVDGFKQYQVSCPISAGNSGCPVINDQGQVVGITSWTKMDAQNLNFAIPCNYVAGLNPSLTMTPWSQLARRRGKSSSADNGRELGSVKTGGPSKGLPDLRNLMNESAGKRITVVVLQDGEEEQFTFTVPKNLLTK